MWSWFEGPSSAGGGVLWVTSDSERRVHSFIFCLLNKKNVERGVVQFGLRSSYYFEWEPF